MDQVYVDEASNVNPAEFDKCRTCGVWKLIHLGELNGIFNTEACGEYLPTDNLLYLELMEQKAILRRWYEQST